MADNGQDVSNNVNFSARQLRAIEWLATPKMDRKPPTQALLAADIGVREETITRWKREQDFKMAIVARARELLGDDLPQVYGALRREADKGQFQHIKLILELTGEYKEPEKPTGELTIRVVGGVSLDDDV